ncbi:hypothetical protein PIB30_046444 [Stylosanthes scabra]|uniref:Replication protein A 70 kDa DNA-binding subunit B/D first OB fold domain-containing protein n=1 Tax=Stylosanthes scabra TaxID=79078 RepID=A0ABU6YIT5_9FABA|nr:hypothetical protein [Stylosanthes scabra]
MPPPFDEISKIHPPREAWRLKVRVLRMWIVPLFGNQDIPNSMELIFVDDEHGSKIQATMEKQMLDRFGDQITEGQEGSFMIFGVIRAILEKGSWWYASCVCGKTIQPRSGAYYCDFCEQYVVNATPRAVEIIQKEFVAAPKSKRYLDFEKFEVHLNSSMLETDRLYLPVDFARDIKKIGGN